MKNIILLLCLFLYMGVHSYAQQKHISAITINRTPCFGKCKVYAVRIDENGSVVYDGKLFVKYKGLYRKQVGKKAVANIFKLAEQYRLDTCQNRYDLDITDVPYLNYSITYTYGQKDIEKANFGPAFLSKLAEKIDALAKVDKTWIKEKK